MSEQAGSEQAPAFDCPNCGDTTGIDGVNDLEDVAGRVFSCEGCGAKIKLNLPTESGR